MLCRVVTQDSIGLPKWSLSFRLAVSFRFPVSHFLVHARTDYDVLLYFCSFVSCFLACLALLVWYLFCRFGDARERRSERWTQVAAEKDLEMRKGRMERARASLFGHCCEDVWMDIWDAGQLFGLRTS